ncbi:hypothetical protein BUALT_Bualt15G0096500 [Buddleja alternifolia]|uniref:Uncharacterized protein n=1 Tax=Buddleja alternifolia TaxID=168488 RepID=A0AAV6WFT0_9LAMI|nr:hypothetical protein BUALT_Bualt15G0096500 [Buddleja alternifolia]
MLHKSSSSERSLENSKDFGTFLSGIENDGKINNLDQHVIDDELTNDYNLAKKETDRESGQGNLGWKVFAATSVFRPTSPRRVPKSDKDLSIGRSNLNFDLNVAENADAKTKDQSESSVETNSRKSERLKLDLNLTSEMVPPPSDWQMAQLFPHGNGHSSSSSSKQPSLRNINLNDQPSFLNDPSDNFYLSKFSQNFNGVKSDDSVISIMSHVIEI